MQEEDGKHEDHIEDQTDKEETEEIDVEVEGVV